MKHDITIDGNLIRLDVVMLITDNSVLRLFLLLYGMLLTEVLSLSLHHVHSQDTWNCVNIQ